MALSLLFAAAFTVESTLATGQRVVETVEVPETNRVVRFVWPRTRVPKDAVSVKVTPDFARARKGEEGYFVFPNNEMGTFRLDAGRTVAHHMMMPVYGMKTPRRTFLAVCTGMPYAMVAVAEAKDGAYAVSADFTRHMDDVYEDLVIEYQFLEGDDADYSGIARAYRKRQLDRGACRPLAVRAKERPELAYAATNIEVRIRQGWKPVPSPVPEQTLRTEPKVRCLVSFDRVKDIVRESKRQGIAGQEICLVGWVYGGHDGAYPQIFPVEPSFGGEEKLKEAIRFAQDEGYQIVGHCNFRDAYLIADTWDSEYILEKRPDGTLRSETQPTWGGGRKYTICPQRAYERFAVKQCAEMRALGFRGLQYNDVATCTRLIPCNDPRHRLNCSERAVWEGNILGEMQRVFGGAASEGGYDFCIDKYDSALTIQWCKPFVTPKNPLVDGYVPFWQLVYHGIILSTPFRSTMNVTLDPDPRMRLKLAEFGGRPTFYWYSQFRDDVKFGGMDFDLVCSTDDELRHSVAKVKEGYDDFARRRDLQYAFMDRHDVLREGLVRVTYSNGAKMYVNYNEQSEKADGIAIPALDYLIVK